MRVKYRHLLLVAVAAVAAIVVAAEANYVPKKYSLFMPYVNPFRDELYLCTPVKIRPEKNFYIVGFEPNATMNTVHHMILFGCSKPGTNDPYWDCGEMSSSSKDRSLRRGNPCADGSNVVYAWARDAEALSLPDGVGFQIGKGTQIAYLVLQVHYAHKFPEDVIDSSGVNLVYTEEPQGKLAGVILLATGGTIKPNSITRMESDCEIEENKVIHPFAYRTHTHGLGKVVSGYQVRWNGQEDEWIELGKRDPLTPQMFYPTHSTAPIRQGDILAARCTMESHRNFETHVGPTNNDEMCNFYLMYYVENDTPLSMKYCFTQGPPYHFWNNRKEFKHIPDLQASIL